MSIQTEKILNNAGINFVKILAEDKPEFVASLKIMQVPTLIVRKRREFKGVIGYAEMVETKPGVWNSIKNNFDERFVGVSDIYKF